MRRSISALVWRRCGFAGRAWFFAHFERLNEGVSRRFGTAWQTACGGFTRWAFLCVGQRGGVGWQRGIGFGGTECPCVGDSERLGRRIHGMGFLVLGSAYNGIVGSGFAA